MRGSVTRIPMDGAGAFAPIPTSGSNPAKEAISSRLTYALCETKSHMAYVRVIVIEDKKHLGDLVFARLPRFRELVEIADTLYRVSEVLHTPQTPKLKKIQPVAVVFVLLER